MTVTFSVQVVLQDGADPEAAGEALFDFLCSVGENSDAVAAVDELVQTFDTYDVELVP